MVFAPVNYGPTQRHQKIDVTLGHPGRVVATGKPMMLANTDEHQSFVKILQTFRAGSVVFAPMIWGAKTLGLIVCAAQARNTMSADDLEVHTAYANLAAALWIAHAGPALLARLA